MLKPLRTVAFWMLLSTLALTGCSGGGDTATPHFFSPYALRIVSKDVIYDGNNRRLGYVSNTTAGTLTLVAIRDRFVLDDDRFDKEETSIAVGGSPADIFEWLPAAPAADLLYRLVVVDRENRQLTVMDAKSGTINGVASVVHQFADTGQAEVVFATRPTFFDRGRRSNPLLNRVDVDAGAATSQSWFIRNVGEGEWRMEGSVSGEQANRVFANTPYVSDDGTISFMLLEGDLRATTDDTFFFGVGRNRPIPLSGTPEAAVLHGDTVYIVDKDNVELDRFNLATMSFDTSIALNDGTGNRVIPTKMRVAGDQIIVSNRGEGNSVLLVNTASATVQPLVVGFKTQNALTGFNNTVAFLLPVERSTLETLDLPGLSLGTPLALGAPPFAAALLNGDEAASGTALAISQGMGVDLLDLENRRRVDTIDRGDIESFATPPIFFDEKPDSNPTLAEVVTNDGVTKTENWVLNYEGVIEGSTSAAGTISGDRLTDPQIDFQSLPLQIDDTVEILYANSTLREEVRIAEIISSQEVRLNATPSAQGSPLAFRVRATEAFTLKGSVSGFQQARLRESGSASSDNSEITLSMSTPSQAATRGDFFTFSTEDGITSIAVAGSLPTDMVVFEKRAYILNQGSSSISVVNINPRDLDIDRVID